jgi:hypothetical protein
VTGFKLVDLSSQEAYTNNILYGRYAIGRGRTLLYRAGTVVVTDSPLDTDLLAADWYILGGHDPALTETQANQLTNAGYGALVETV